MKKLKNEKLKEVLQKNYWKKLKGRSDNARLNKKQKDLKSDFDFFEISNFFISIFTSDSSPNNLSSSF